MRLVPLPFFARSRHCSTAAVLLLAGSVACSSLPSHSPNAGPPLQPLSETERIAHVLSRLTFGARPGDAERLKRMGVKRWIDEQLRPATIDDSALETALASIPAWTDVTTTLGSIPELPRTIPRTPTVELMKDSVALAKLQQVALRMKIVSLQARGDYFY